MDLYEIDDVNGGRIFSSSGGSYSNDDTYQKRIEKIEKEIRQMHALLNKLCPGNYGAKHDLTLAEKFEKLLTEGPEWTEVKRNK